MTSKEYDRIRDELSNKDICDFAERMCRESKIEPERDYPQRVGTDVMLSAARRHMYLSRAIDLLRRMIFLGATSGEVCRASEYLMVILHSIEHSLDYKGCEKELRIPDLEKKYTRESFFDADISPEEFLSVIKRDNGYYPVPIKEVMT